MVFKEGDVVIITLPKDYNDSPGFNIDMEALLEGCNFKIKLSRIQDKDRGWWCSSTDIGKWIWPETWMKKVNKFKGNK